MVAKNKKQSLFNKITQYDMFGESATFTIEDQATYNGVCGTIISLLITIIVMAYGAHRAIVVYEHGDTAFQTNTERDNLNKTKVFSFAETQFNIAVGISASDSYLINAEDYKRYFSFTASVFSQEDPKLFDLSVR